MMRYWFDTEFHEDGKTIELISIGVVAEDGREYYAETPFSDILAHKHQWLRANVWPSLLGPGAQKERAEIASDLIKFMGEKPEIWAYYADYDWVVLCQLYGRMINLPEGWPMYCRDLKQLADHLGVRKFPVQLTGEHNALEDARWTKQMWERIRE